MPARSNLVATPIVDKNGKSTIVHRRASSTGDNKSSIPSPRAIDKEPKLSSEEALNSTLERFCAAGITKTTSRNNIQFIMLDNLERLSLADPDLLVEVTDHILAAGEHETQCWEWSLISEEICLKSTSKKAEYRRAYKTLMGIQPVVAKIASQHPIYSLQSVSADLLDQAGKAARYVGAKDVEYHKAAAIYVGLKMLSDDRPDMTVRLTPEGREVIRFIADRVDEVEPLLDELIKRRTVDPAVIDQLVDSPSALSSGNL